MTSSSGAVAGAGRQLHLNAFLMTTGHHEASWRLPESDSFAGTQVAHFQRLARTAERGTFDSIFFADSPVLHGDVAPAALRHARAHGAAKRHRGGH